MRVLVTGGAGYVGSEATRLLRASGHEPVVLDTLENGHREAVPGVELVVGSVTDEALVQGLLVDRRIEAVMHFAALKAAEESIREPGRYFATNAGGSFTLLAAMEAARVPWFVFSSTCAVYGEPQRVPIAEDADTRPETPYGESKLLVERALPWYEARGVVSVSLRYFNAAGAAADGAHGEDWRRAPNLVPVAIKSALGRGAPLRIFGTDYPTPDGTAVRDYVHIADLADAHVRALGYLAGGGGATTLNLGTGSGLVGPGGDRGRRGSIGADDRGDRSAPSAGRSGGSLGRAAEGGGDPRLAGTARPHGDRGVRGPLAQRPSGRLPGS